MANPGTRFNKIVSVGAPLSAFAALAATVMLYVYGGLTVHGVIRSEGVPSELTESGSTSTVQTALRVDFKAMSATGALANGKAPTFRWQNPKTQTAAVLNFCLDIFTAPSVSMKTNCWVNNENFVGSGGIAPIKYLIRNMPVTKGHICSTPINGTPLTTSGSKLFTVGPDEQIKCSNSVGDGSGSQLVGDGMVQYYTTRQ